MEILNMTRKQAAALCNVSLPTLDEYLHRNESPIPHFRAGRKYLIPRAGLEKWLEEEAERQQHGRAV